MLRKRRSLRRRRDDAEEGKGGAIEKKITMRGSEGAIQAKFGKGKGKEEYPDLPS